LEIPFERPRDRAALLETHEYYPLHEHLTLLPGRSGAREGDRR
jgi:hypothetical protein